MANKSFTCRTCGAQFLHDRKKAYCSENCRPSHKLLPAKTICAECQELFDTPRGKRPPTKYCRACKLIVRARQQIDNTRRRTREKWAAKSCEACAASGVSTREGLCKTCSCKSGKILKAWRNRVKTPPPIPVIRDGVLLAMPIPECQCAVCGKVFRPSRAENRTACSRECGFKWQAAKASAAATGMRVTFRTLRNKCGSCGSVFSHRGSYCSDACTPSRQPMLVAECKGCGQEFNRTTVGASRFFCSPHCVDSAKKAAARRSRKSPSAIANKKLRKALARGAKGGEKVDPLLVFERDGYRCGICGGRTLKAKRGTHHPRAPELDHIVALANGGEHTYRNTQCACRACNGLKGAKDYGQIPLFAFG